MFLFIAAWTNRVQQRTQFATSSFRHRISDAVDFRNRFAHHPFVCRELMEPGNIFVSLDVCFLVDF